MQKIKFRRYNENDLKFIDELLEDEATRKYFPFMYTSDISQSELRLKTRITDDWFLISKDDFHTLVIMNEMETPVGEINYTLDEKNYDTAELAIIIHPDYRGKGYAKAATLEYIKKIKKQLSDVKKIKVIIEESNISSKTVAKTLEFKFKEKCGYNNNLEEWEKEI